MIYSISTGVICIFLALSAASYLFHQQTIDGVRLLGLPDYLRIELAVLKILAVPALCVSGVPAAVQGSAYAGVALFLLTAIVAHAAHRDSFVFHATNVGLCGVLFVSWQQSGL